MSIPNLVFRLVEVIERVAAYAQGKGYGASTIGHEVAIALKTLRTSGRAPELVVDIGGNVGEYTAEMRRRNRDVEIHVFEPSATNIEKLSKRFGGDRKTTLVPIGISDNSGSATLFANAAGSGLGSLTKRDLNHFEIPFEFQETVSTVRFEEYWSSHLGRRAIDIAKIDIEGHELFALEGFGKAIEATRVLQFEFGGTNIDTRTYFRDFWRFFERNNFKIYRITPLGLQAITRYLERHENFLATNFIAANQRMF